METSTIITLCLGVIFALVGWIFNQQRNDDRANIKALWERLKENETAVNMVKDNYIDRFSDMKKCMEAGTQMLMEEIHALKEKIIVLFERQKSKSK